MIPNNLLSFGIYKLAPNSYCTAAYVLCSPTIACEYDSNIFPFVYICLGKYEVKDYSKNFCSLGGTFCLVYGIKAFKAGEPLIIWPEYLQHRASYFIQLTTPPVPGELMSH